MTALIEALTRLNKSLENLEYVATEQEQKVVQLKQQELFAEEQAANGNGQAAIDPALLAKKLDVAIERVEQVLQEG